jgi:putative transposase
MTRPNQRGQTDRTYGYSAGEDRVVYVQAIVDGGARRLIASHIGLSCRAADAAHTLQRAVEARRAAWGVEPPVMRTDHGPPCTAPVLEARCDAWGLTHERMPVATPNAQADIEAWPARLDRECFRQELAPYAEA